MIDAALFDFGAGALFAWLALPVLAWAAAARPAPAVARHHAPLAALGCAVLLLAVPWLPAMAPSWIATHYTFELRAVVASTHAAGSAPGIAGSSAFSPFTLVGIAWLLALSFTAARTAVGVVTLSGLLARADLAPSELVRDVRMRAQRSGSRVPALLVSDECAIPFTTGLWTPVIVLPRELLLSLERSALDLVLAQELEHVRRHDAWISALVTSLKIALGAHPTAVRLAREVLLAGEVAVDAQVSQRDRRAYASLLVEIAAQAQLGAKPAPVAIDDSALSRRIALIVEPVTAGPISLPGTALTRVQGALVHRARDRRERRTLRASDRGARESGHRGLSRASGEAPAADGRGGARVALDGGARAAARLRIQHAPAVTDALCRNDAECSRQESPWRTETDC